MTKVLLVDDEKYIRLFLKQIINQIPGITEVFDTASSKEAVSWSKINNPDLVILDIELKDPGINGIDLAGIICETNKNTIIVFVTAYGQYAVDSFTVHPYSYVLKPIDVEGFKNLVKEIVHKIECQYKSNADKLTLKINDELVHLSKEDILFIEVEHHKSIIHTQSGIWESSKSLNDIGEILGPGFLRVHRSFIVNLDRIKTIKAMQDRSYEIEFYNYSRRALMSRYHFPKYKKHFRL